MGMDFAVWFLGGRSHGVWFITGLSNGKGLEYRFTDMVSRFHGLTIPLDGSFRRRDHGIIIN